MNFNFNRKIEFIIIRIIIKNEKYFNWDLN